MENKLTKILGIFLIAIGIGYLGDQLYFWNFTIFFDGWWAVLITLLALFSMMEDGINVWNGIIALLGIYFFMEENNLIHFEISFLMIASILLIVLGVKLIVAREKHPSLDTEKTKSQEFTTNNNTNYDNEEKKVYINSNFTTKRIKETGIVNRCRIESLIGNVTVDLSEADLRTIDAISIDAVFGSVEVIVGPDVNLKLYKNRILSGCYIDNSYSDNGYEVMVRGSSIFGNIKVYKVKPV